MWNKRVRIYGTPGVHNNYPKLRRQCHSSQGKGKGQEGKRWSKLSALIVSPPITHICLICFDNFLFLSNLLFLQLKCSFSVNLLSMNVII